MTDPLSALGAVTSIIGLLGEAKDLYNKFKDVRNLPEAFKKISTQIDLAKSIFEKIKDDTNLVSQTSEVKATIKSCELDAQELRTIYELVNKNQQSRWWQRYLDHVRAVSKDRPGAVEKVWGDLMNRVKLLAERYRMEDVSKIEKAIAEIADLRSSLEPENAGNTFNAQTVGQQGNNYGSQEFTMGNKILGNYINNYGAEGKGFMSKFLSFMQSVVFANSFHDIYLKMSSWGDLQPLPPTQPSDFYAAIDAALADEERITHPADPPWPQDWDSKELVRDTEAKQQPAPSVVEKNSAKLDHAVHQSQKRGQGHTADKPSKETRRKDTSKKLPEAGVRSSVAQQRRQGQSEYRPMIPSSSRKLGEKKRAVGDLVRVQRTEAKSEEMFECKVTAIREVPVVGGLEYQVELVDGGAPGAAYERGKWLPPHRLLEGCDRRY